MLETVVAKKLKPIEKQLYEVCHQGFAEAQKDKFWALADNRYRATRVWTIITYLLEQAFSEREEIQTDKTHNSCRFSISDVVFRIKKLSGKKGLPQNVQTRRNAKFLNGQLSLFQSYQGSGLGVIPGQLAITVGYWTDKFFNKINAIEVVCHSLGFRYEIAEPHRIIRISDHQKEPKKETKVKASKAAKEKRKKDVKHEEDSKS